MRVGLRGDGPLDPFIIATGLVPQPVYEGFMAFAMARAVMAGTSLGVFAALEERPDDAEGIAKRLGLQADGTDVLLHALHTLGYVERHDDGAYANTKVTRRYLLPGERSVEDWTASFSYDMWDTFAELERVLRTGESQSIHTKEADDGYWERYMRGLHQIARLGATRVAKMLSLGDPRSGLDLAGGHGAFSVALCKRHPELRMTIVELEGAARIGRAIVAEADMGDRVTFVVEDLFESDLGTGHDVVMANNILHHFSAEDCVRALRRAKEALASGGTVAVVELERPPEGKRGDQVGALSGLLFYVSSRARTWSAASLVGFMEDAGLERVKARHHPELAGSVLVVGRA